VPDGRCGGRQPVAIRFAGLGLALAALAGCHSAPAETAAGNGSEIADARGAATGDGARVDGPAGNAAPVLGLFTSLPIFWSEGDVGDLLSNESRPHWARELLARDYRLQPVDRLTALEQRSGAVPAGREPEDQEAPDPALLVMAQPRALAPDENVALDDWVRAGGHLLLLADPMLQAHSVYGLGDRRRPEAITMLSPILARWGLDLRYDEGQAEGERLGQWRGVALPVEQAGTLRKTGAGHKTACAIEAGGLIAECRIGEGRVLVLADAAFLEEGTDPSPEAESALRALVRTAAGDPSTH